MTIKSHVLDSISVDSTEPHIVAFAEGIEDVKCDVRMAHFRNNSSICTVSSVNSTVLFGLIADHRLGSFEGVHMILKSSHNFVLIEVRHPMEEGIQVSCGISVKGFTNRVNRNVIVHKFYLRFVLFEGLDHKIFLVAMDKIESTLRSGERNRNRGIDSRHLRRKLRKLYDDGPMVALF